MDCFIYGDVKICHKELYLEFLTYSLEHFRTKKYGLVFR